MRQVNIHEAKTRLSELIAAAERGEEVVIARAHQPAVRLVPVRPRPGVTGYGCMRGRGRIIGDVISPVEERWDAER
ncbi:MAG: type II toxin-antitoxin system prevent-host-death family antitoxin [Pseudomonadota bacterium]|jgi:prevent-host-death family protein